MTWEIVVQTGHLINITGVSFAPGGRSIASCSADESIRLWDVGLGCEAGVLRGHQGPVYHVLHSSDGQLLASAGWDHDVRIWDVAARQCVQVLKGVDRHPVYKLAFSLDGNRAAATGTGVQDTARQLLVWNVATGSTVANLDVPGRVEGLSAALALTADGTMVAFADAHDHVCLLDLSSLEQRVLLSDLPTVQDLAFAVDGSALFVLSDRLTIVDLTGRTTQSERQVPPTPTGLQILADGRCAVFTAGSTLLHGPSAHNIPLPGIAMSDDGRLLAQIAGRQLELFDTQSESLVRRLGGRLDIKLQPGNKHRQFVVATSPVEPLVAAAGPDGLIRLWDLARAPAPTVIEASDGWIEALGFSSDGKSLFSCGHGGVRLWHRDGMHWVAGLTLPSDAMHAAFSAERSALVVGGGDRLRVVDIATGAELAAIQVGKEIEALAISDWNDVAVATFDELKVWEAFLTSDPTNVPIPAQGNALSFGRNGELGIGIGHMKWLGFNLPANSLKGTGVVLRRGGEPVRALVGHAAAVKCIAFSPDGRVVATGGAEGALMLWDATTGARLAETAAHSGDVTGVAWTHDGARLVTTGYDGAVRVWESAELGVVASLLSLDDQDFVAVCADGHYSATKDGLRAVMLRTDDGLYPFEQFDLQLNRPDVVLTRLGYASPEVVGAYADAHRRRLARQQVSESNPVSTADLPIVSLSETPPAATQDGTVALKVSASSGGRPLARLHVTVNDVPVLGRLGSELVAESGHAETQLDVTLTPGDNEIQMWAVDDGGNQSMRRTVRVFDSRPDAARRLFVLTVGVSAYHDSRYSLRYAAKDAQDLALEFRRQGRRFSAVETLALVDATLEQIRESREFLLRSETGDHVVVLFAGHGALLGSDFVFLPADVQLADLATTALRYDDIEGLLDGIPARRRLVLLDTCHSGEEDFDSRGSDPLPAGVSSTRREVPVDSPTLNDDERTARPSALLSLGEVFADLRQESGAFVVAAAGSREYALEREDLRNGVFTASVIQALRSADDMSVTAFARFVADRVRTLTANRQRPMIRRENLADDYLVV